MMGCNTSFNATGHTSPNMTDIAQYVSATRGARNSMGYQTLVYSFAGNKPIGQEWFNCLYLYGLDVNPISESGEVAQNRYLHTLYDWGEFRACDNPQSSPNWGWDTWVVTQPGLPMLNY
jgi:hypothetical protein